MSNRDWNNDDSVVVKAVTAIAVYVNEHDEIVVCQQSPMQEEESFIYFPKSQAKVIAKAIINAIKE